MRHRNVTGHGHVGPAARCPGAYRDAFARPDRQHRPARLRRIAMIDDELDRYRQRQLKLIDLDIFAKQLQPAIHPPWEFSGIVDTMSAPTGGAWMLKNDGAIYAVGGAPYLGGMRDPEMLAHWLNIDSVHGAREAVQLEPKGNGYSIVSQFGERYSFV